MNKNTIHNFNISIENSTNIQSSEQLTKNMIKELAKVSKEISQHKDIEQLWQEQKDQNAILNLANALTEEGATDKTAAMFEKTASSAGITSSVSGQHMTNNRLQNIFPLFENTSISGVLNNATNSVNKTTINSDIAVDSTPMFLKADESTTQLDGFVGQQRLTVPEMFQINTNEPSIEVLKAEVKKKLDFAIATDDTEGIQYWTRISKAFDNGAVAADFAEKPEEILFTQMYLALKKSMFSSVEIQNFNWDNVCKKMIEAININILTGTISQSNKKRWEIIKNLLANDKTNVANLFEQYDELFLLLKEVEGLADLPTTITIITKTKIYPNLSADKVYGAVGKEDVYVFLKQVSKTNFEGSAVNKGAVNIKSGNATTFIVGESLEFFVDETFINQKLHQKENINWVVYNSNTKKEVVFKNEGTSFNYNFDQPGTYRIDAYGQNHTVKQKKDAKTATFIELTIVVQDIVITYPANIKGDFARAFVEEKNFKVSLKNTAVKTLNPLKLYYQIETAVNGKTVLISEERELDATGIIKLAMPDLGIYKIKLASKDQYGVVKEFKTSVIENEVTSISYAKGTPNKDVFLIGNLGNTLTLEPKTYKINPPTDKEKEDVKWMIYDSNNKPYAQPGEIRNENNDPKKPFILKWESFIVPIPQKVGNYTVEAYYNIKKGPKDGAIFKIEVKQPEITEAYWASQAGSKKLTSGFSGESNWIKANIPHYENQMVRIYFYLNNKKTKYYVDTKTIENGIISKEIKFDSNFKKLIGFPNNGTAKVGFKLLGIQNAKPYAFKTPINYESDTILSVTTDKKILDVFFRYEGNRVMPQDEIPFDKSGVIVTIVAKTQNMTGDEITLKAHKIGEEPLFSSKVIVNSDGVAATSFILKKLDESLKNGTVIKYYAGVEGYSTKHLDNKVLVMIVGEGNISKTEIIDENDPQLIWGVMVSKEFRKKVVKICKNIEEKKDVSFSPNTLMNIMAFETANSFSPQAGTFKKIMDDNKNAGFVGLIQFGKAASEQLKVKRSELYNMTAEKQLDYVEKWFLLKTKNELKSATDIYLSVNYPKKAGIGHLDYEIVYGDPNAAYRANKPFLKEADEIDKKGNKVGKEGGNTYVWEVRETLEESEKDGQYSKNTILLDKSYNAIMNNPKEIFNLDTSLTFCYFSANQIKEIRKVIDKFNTNEEKIKAYRILQYFVEYNSQRDAKYKSLADTMCNVTSESIALQYLGQMNPAPDPNIKMEDFLMIMIRDILKEGDDARLFVGTRIRIANELGIKASYKEVGSIYNKNEHKKLLEDKLNKGYGVCMSALGHIVRVVDVNDLGIIVDDPFGRIQSFKVRKANGEKGGYNGGKNNKNNMALKGESNLWTWKQLENDRITFRRYEWYYL